MSTNITLMPLQTPYKNKFSLENKARLDLAVVWILDPESVDPNTMEAPGPTQAYHKYQLDAKKFSKLISRVFRRAIKALIKSAIDSLFAKEPLPREFPSERWFSIWLKTRKNALGVHEIKTKPISQARLEFHFSAVIKEWSVDYRNWIRIRKIRKAKRV
ncbi:hypothetical protein EPUL_001898 [Erysiphe pulchra]|uniref:Uncharacterized protein n=1 Tax=Erysiphe pulchra TaxID=225359 RepID=A0A2S4PXH7_9PEZI|nr:hypothetical protein EPUL_001898 [Erysiphe pulchra]